MAFRTDLARKSWESVEAAQLAVELNSPTTQSCEICPLRRSIQSCGKFCDGLGNKPPFVREITRRSGGFCRETKR